VSGEGDFMDWLTGVLAFLGAGLGALLSYLAAQRGTAQRDQAALRDRGQREEQGHLEEWGRRFTAALEDIASDSFRRRELGRVVLVELSRSHLATDEERELAKAVLEAGARLEPDGDVLLSPPRSLTMDDLEFVEDNGGDDEEGQ
jgi:hypothetical protein